MKLAFLGTSEFAVPALRALVDAGHDVIAVYTRAPKPAGRGQQERRTPVHELALSLGLPCARRKACAAKRKRRPSRRSTSTPPWSSSYGHILPKAFLEAPVLGCINIHGSLLPRWRGAAPIHRAILAGDAETGVTTMRMDEGLDTGPMLLAERTPISAADTAETVHDRLAELGAPADRVDSRRAARQDASSRCRSPRRASPTPTSSARRKARSTGGGRRPSSSARCAPSIPGPGTWFDVQGERIKVLARRTHAGRRRAGHGERRPRRLSGRGLRHRRAEAPEAAARRQVGAVGRRLSARLCAGGRHGAGAARRRSAADLTP